MQTNESYAPPHEPNAEAIVADARAVAEEVCHQDVPREADPAATAID
jgi:hypothetical protein